MPQAKTTKEQHAELRTLHKELVSKQITWGQYRIQAGDLAIDLLDDLEVAEAKLYVRDRRDAEDEDLVRGLWE